MEKQFFTHRERSLLIGRDRERTVHSLWISTPGDELIIRTLVGQLILLDSGCQGFRFQFFSVVFERIKNQRYETEKSNRAALKNL